MSHPTTQLNPFGEATCMEMLQLVLDGQATEEQVAYWKAHLGMCQPCYEKYKVDNAVIEKVKSECCCSKIPQDVIEELSGKIKNIA
jgi:anti-sigma factor (TIGR02949 family)